MILMSILNSTNVLKTLHWPALKRNLLVNECGLHEVELAISWGEQVKRSSNKLHIFFIND